MLGRRALVGWLGLVLMAASGPAPLTAVPMAATAAPVPFMALIPSCGPPAPLQPATLALTYSIEVIGRNLGTVFGVYIVFNPGAKQQAFNGHADTKQSVDQVIRPLLVPPGTYSVEIQDLDNVRLASAQFAVPCPPTPPGTSPSPPSRSSPPPVLNPTLTLTPAVGPPGTVTVAHGVDFPANTGIQLGWSQGIVSTTSTAIVTDGKGDFTATILIFPHDELGARVLTAVSVLPPNSSLFGFASATFLVVPGAAQPRDFSWRR